MNLSTQSQTENGKIEAYLVSDHARIGTLPRHFGSRMLLVEQTIYDFMRQFDEKYTGGMWDFLELSNGGFYMRPSAGDKVQLNVESNGYAGAMTTDATGIVACLFCFSHLSLQYNDQHIARHFHRLRDFALSHREAGEIFAAID